MWMHVAGRRYDSAMLLWKIDETAGFDAAWASVSGGRLEADGRAAGLRPRPYWVEYRLETEGPHPVPGLRMPDQRNGEETDYARRSPRAA